MSTWTTLRKRGLRDDELWTNLPFDPRLAWIIPFRSDVHALMESQYWPREKLEKLQDARVRELLREARQIPFWRNRLEVNDPEKEMASFDILSRLAVTSKKDFADKPADHIANLRHNRSWQDHTSGSTGRPFRFFHDNHYALRSLAVCERMFRAAGNGTRHPLVTMRSRWRPGVFLSRGAFFYLKGYSSLRFRLPDLKETIRRFPGGVVLQGFSSSLLELARLLEDQRESLPIKSVLATGEGLSRSQRTYIEKVLRSRVFMGYTTRELGWLGFECEQHRMHINEEWAYVEIIDGAGKPVAPDTEGRIVVTTFDNRVMPFIRYDTGDRGTISGSPCPCGRTLRTIRIVGRALQTITLPEGRVVSLLDIAGAFDVFWDAVRQYQIVQHGPARFDIKVVPGPLFDGSRDELEAKLIGFLHPAVHIRWHIVGSIPDGPGGKAVYFVRE